MFFGMVASFSKIENLDPDLADVNGPFFLPSLFFLSLMGSHFSPHWAFHFFYWLSFLRAGFLANIHWANSVSSSLAGSPF